ncbi:MAG: hypothetical protein PHG82_01085 [Candidatus Gracilibacteria bacterium]|nr:hypothetical protein [Candidatus Gracilibacteria bacterium]
MRSETSTLTLKEKLKILLIVILAIIFGYIGGIYGSIDFIIALSFYSLFLYTLIFPFKKFKDRDFEFFNAENLGKFAFAFAYRMSAFLIIIFSILGGFAYYQNKISPAMMPIYEISNGDKTVVFHSMSHIASPEFYTETKKYVENLEKSGYLLFYEGVKPGTKESSLKFDKALGVKFDKDLYKNMSKLYGLVNQDNSIFVSSGAKNVDLSMDEIIALYDKIPSQNRLSQEVVDVNPLINATLDSLNPKELEILRFLNKAIINTIIKNGDIQDAMSQGLGNKALMDTIFGKRNDNLAASIIEEKQKKIVITYGLLHFKGVLELLQKNDANWKIKKVDYSQVVR